MVLQANHHFPSMNNSLQKEIHLILDNMIVSDFECCNMKFNQDDRFYSPFVLALIGIILIALEEKDTSLIVDRINSKLENTPNDEGLYNFYGDNQYYFDADTTSTVNTFFFLYGNTSKSYHYSILKRLGKNGKTNLVSTWFGRSRNNTDWFVNYNYWVYCQLLGENNKILEEYLKSNFNHFLRNGSRYYQDTSFPLFFLQFHSLENNISFENNAKEKSYKHNLFKAGVDALKGNDKLSYNEPNNYINALQVYFNSSTNQFISRELNAAISLYLEKQGATYDG